MWNIASFCLSSFLSFVSFISECLLEMSVWRVKYDLSPRLRPWCSCAIQRNVEPKTDRISFLACVCVCMVLHGHDIFRKFTDRHTVSFGPCAASTGILILVLKKYFSGIYPIVTETGLCAINRQWNSRTTIISRLDISEKYVC